MIRLLIITHWPAKNTTSREAEIASALSNKMEVYWLDWDIPDTSSRSRIIRLLYRIKHAVDSLFRQVAVDKSGRVFKATMPFVLTRPYTFIPDSIVWYLNRLSLKRLISKYSITHVLNANAKFFPVPDIPGLIKIYDLVDDHANMRGKVNHTIEKFITRELGSSTRVITISNALREIIRQRYKKEAVVIPNGGDPEKFNHINDSAIAELKARWGLQGKKVIGCIGNHNHWAGLDFLLEAFALLQANVPDTVLFIVGPGSEVEKLKNIPEGVIITGPIPPKDIAAYFAVLDIGTLPFTQEPFTDNALPIKIIEYGFAKKPVVATPLKELKTIAFPHVNLVERNAALWCKALEKALVATWDCNWDTFLEKYQWNNISKRIESIINVR